VRDPTPGREKKSNRRRKGRARGENNRLASVISPAAERKQNGGLGRKRWGKGHGQSKKRSLFARPDRYFSSKKGTEV